MKPAELFHGKTLCRDPLTVLWQIAAHPQSIALVNFICRQYLSFKVATPVANCRSEKMTRCHISRKCGAAL
jgi:hypothetical protein